MHPYEEDVPARVRAVIRSVAPNPAGADRADDRLVEDAGFHSLALLELAFALEEEYDLPPMDDAGAQQIVTVGDVEDFVLDQLRARGAARPTADG